MLIRRERFLPFNCPEMSMRDNETQRMSIHTDGERCAQ